MVVMQLPDGTTREYRLRSTKAGLRLVRPCASYDLLTVMKESGWRIRAIKSDGARKRLERTFGAQLEEWVLRALVILQLSF